MKNAEEFARAQRRRGIKLKWSPQSKIGTGLDATGRVYQPPTDCYGRKSKAGEIGRLHMRFDVNGDFVLYAGDYPCVQTLAVIRVNGDEFEAAFQKAKTNPTVEEASQR